MIRSVRRVLAALGWVVAVLAISLGAAGLVTALDAPPGSVERPELTRRGDALVTPLLDAQEAELRRLADDVTALAAEARTALTSLNGTDLEAVEGAVAAGDALVMAIRDRSAAIARALDDVPLIGTPDGAYQLAEAVRGRHARLAAAPSATARLGAAWVRLTTGSIAASRLSGLLAAHDEAVLAAAALGRDARYAEAVTTLDDAQAAIAAARVMRDRLAATVDVTTLDAWLDRNADYDTALRALYVALDDVGGRVTSAVREAIDAERAAKEGLPPDSRGLILIMAEIGRGGMNSAIVAIEEARGSLADALVAGAAGALDTAPNPGSAPPP